MSIAPVSADDDTVLSVRTMAFGVLIPVGAYDLLRLGGVDAFIALLLTAGLSSLGTVRQIVRSRRYMSLDAAMLFFTVAGIGQTLITGNPRFLLAIDSCLTFMARIWFMSTARSNRPFAFVVSRFLLENRFGFSSVSWATLWDQDPTFRRIWRVSTLAWGLGSVVDAMIRLLMAITLPVDTVPALNTMLYVVTFVALQVITNVYYHRAGLWMIVRPPAVLRGGAPG
jgi:hypothetical protein